MRQLLVFGAASWLAVLASSSDFSALPRDHHHKEMFWPTLHSRGLSSSSEHLGRGLQEGSRGACVRTLLAVAEPAIFQVWSDCVEQKLQTINTQIAGSIFGAYHDCWCNHSVEDVLVEFGCCDHPDFHLLCEAQCPNERDCTKAEAVQCAKDCPAKCLENDYAPEFCDTGCQTCLPYMGCVVEHSYNMTKSGHPDHDYICDDLGFDNSSQWKEWTSCYHEHPKRTYWHRHNAENYCYCKSKLKDAANEHSCCDAQWGKTICDEECSGWPATPDCTSAEATSCGERCNAVCEKFYQTEMTTECQNECFAATATCAKYALCEPVGPFTFDYVCDDGSPPMDNGCCQFSAGAMGCPTLCDSWAPHLPGHNVAGLDFQHGWECQCNGCPSSAQAAKDKWKDTLENKLWQHGVSQLAAISKEEGILGANRKMQELMQERNDQILLAYDDHPTGPDAEFQAKVDIIVAEYHTQIVAEAKRFKASGEVEAASESSASGDQANLPNSGSNGGNSGNSGEKLVGQPTSGVASSQDGDDDDGDSTVVIIGVVGGCVALLLIFGIIVMVYKMKAKTSAPAANPANSGSSPYDGDSNVVMGRPVEGETQAAQGAPVQAGKGSPAPAPDDASKV